MRHFPDTGEQWQVSTASGSFAKWRRDGKELFYDGPDGTLMVVPIHLGESFKSGTPRALFHFDPLLIPEGMASPVPAVNMEGNRFLVVTKAEGSSAPPFEVVLNWPEMVRNR